MYFPIVVVARRSRKFKNNLRVLSLRSFIALRFLEFISSWLLIIEKGAHISTRYVGESKDRKII